VSFAAVKDAGVVTSYVSPESSAIKPGMKDPKGFWTSRYSNVVCIVCNKNKVKTMPTDWKDFTDPKWKGDFSIDSERYNWFFALTKVYGIDGARNLIGGYMRNGALVYRSTPLQIQLVAAGEFSCALGVFLNDVVLLMKGGAPLSYAVPQPVLLNPNIIMMPKFPPNPAGAILLYDYLLSVEGLSPMTSNTPHMPSREDVPVTEEIRELRSKRLYFTDVEEQSRTFSQIGETYNALLKKQ
jgi:ABC-type Fe3+ transport system substrate-binding protein